MDFKGSNLIGLFSINSDLMPLLLLFLMTLQAFFISTPLVTIKKTCMKQKTNFHCARIAVVVLFKDKNDGKIIRLK